MFKRPLLILICCATLLLMDSTTIAMASGGSTSSVAQPLKTLDYKRIGDIAVSPNGQQIAYTVSQIVHENQFYKRPYSLYLKSNVDEKKILSGKYVAQPAWSPDGKLLAYFVKQGKKQSINIYNPTTKQNTPFISLADRSIYAYKWAPDSTKIAFVADDSEKKSDSFGSINISKDYTNSRIYIKSISQKNSAIQIVTPEKESITQMYTPTLDGGLDWSPDSQSIAYTHQGHAGANDAINTKVSIISLKDHKITQIPFMDSHTANQAHYSPNGQWLGFIANIPNSKNNKSDFYENINYNSQICVANTKNLSTNCLTNTFNQSSAIIGWSAASDTIYVLDWYKTKGVQIYAIHLDTKIPTKLISEIDGFIEPLTVTLNADHTYFGFGYETLSKAPEIYISKTTFFELKQITHMQPLFTEKLGTMKVLHWKSHDNLSIEGLLITPPNFNVNKKYPILVDIHGGPSGAFAERFIDSCDEFGDMIIPICLKNALDLGFVILQPNYRGSSGYGIDFRAANVGDLGGGDYADVMSGVDLLIHKGIADPNHLAIYGWSYGGYLTEWAVTQSHLFKSAIAGGGLTDFVSFTGTSDVPRYLRTYLANALWDDKKLYIERSPIFFSKNVDTPLLILHGKDDPRVPVTQSYEFYNSLFFQNKLVSMIVFPHQEHVLTDASSIVSANLETNAWLKKSLN